jgi:two-component system OmpR family sensor kinase
MFRRARVRLTVLYIGLFALVLGAFSLVFYIGFATVLAPTFAYQSTVERIGLALAVADVLMIGLVGVVAWVLAARTLRPIRETHARQRRFVADASHEMRTPLAAIRASAEASLAGATSVDELRGALKIVAISADRLGRITDDLLLLARSEELPPERPRQIDLSVVVAEAVEAFGAAHPELQASRMSLTADLLVAADPIELARIVANLLDNAIRYSGPAAQPPRITTKGSERETVLEVSDDGPGIAAADLDRIFAPFYRVRADAGSPDGSGLGLAIARSLAERNGGRLTAISEPGSGATFRLSLPRFK